MQLLGDGALAAAGEIRFLRYTCAKVRAPRARCSFFNFTTLLQPSRARTYLIAILTLYLVPDNCTCVPLPLRSSSLALLPDPRPPGVSAVWRRKISADIHSDNLCIFRSDIYQLFKASTIFDFWLRFLYHYCN